MEYAKCAVRKNVLSKHINWTLASVAYLMPNSLTCDKWLYFFSFPSSLLSVCSLLGCAIYFAFYILYLSQSEPCCIIGGRSITLLILRIIHSWCWCLLWNFGYCLQQWAGVLRILLKAVEWFNGCQTNKWCGDGGEKEK